MEDTKLKWTFGDFIVIGIFIVLVLMILKPLLVSLFP